MRRLVHRVLHAETADAENGCHALREADEAAILRPTQGATAILRAPGIVLRVAPKCRGPLARQQDLTTQISSGPWIVQMP